MNDFHIVTTINDSKLDFLETSSTLNILPILSMLHSSLWQQKKREEKQIHEHKHSVDHEQGEPQLWIA